MDESAFVNETKAKMSHAIEAYKAELAKIRTGRASTGLIEAVNVEYFFNKIIRQILHFFLNFKRLVFGYFLRFFGRFYLFVCKSPEISDFLFYRF